MVHTVEGSWLRYWRGAPEITVVDPRSRSRYLSGHIPHAISVPASAAFGPDGRLLPDGALADWLGKCGVSTEGTVVVYGDSDGQPAAMLAWILEYLGHPDVAILRTRFEHWRDDGGELSYRPVAPTQTTFTAAQSRPELRATWEDVATLGGRSAIDARNPEEYRGEQVVAQDPPGHIPGAVNVPWLSFVGENADLILGPTQVASRLHKAGIDPRREAVVYCRSGLRASVGWLAIQLAGSSARLYDGSFQDWSQRGDLPIEKGAPATKQATSRRSGRATARDKSARGVHHR